MSMLAQATQHYKFRHSVPCVAPSASLPRPKLEGIFGSVESPLKPNGFEAITGPQQGKQLYMYGYIYVPVHGVS